MLAQISTTNEWSPVIEDPLWLVSGSEASEGSERSSQVAGSEEQYAQTIGRICMTLEGKTNRLLLATTDLAL